MVVDRVYFQFTSVYISSKTNVIADALSRLDGSSSWDIINNANLSGALCCRDLIRRMSHCRDRRAEDGAKKAHSLRRGAAHTYLCVVQPWRSCALEAIGLVMPYLCT